MSWRMPQHTLNPAGAERRCGVELEYTGVPLQRAAELMVELWGGSISWRHGYHATVHTDALGDFTVELDVGWMQKLSEQASEDHRLDQLPLAKTADKLLFPVISSVAPNEIVSPPVPFSRLHQLDALIDRLREAGAKGTGESIVYAFGVHLNPEVPSFDTAVILRYLRAFLLLYEWMKHAMDIDSTRKLTGFARAFPMDYVKLLLSPDYQPDLPTLTEDYLRHNPTRNRALDMLPLLMYLDRERVRREVPDPLVSPRPTFHFRLPNCHIDRAGWRLSDAWDYWLEIEALAWDEPRLHTMQTAFLSHYRNPLHLFSESWRKQTQAWLQNDRA